MIERHTTFSILRKINALDFTTLERLSECSFFAFAFTTHCKWISLLFYFILAGPELVLFSQPKQHPFDFYSSKRHQDITITGLEQWEKERQEIRKCLEEVMGPLPKSSNLPDLDIRIVDSLTTPSYQRYSLTFLAAPNERVTCYLYLPNRYDPSSKSPAILALHPTGEAGKDIVDGQGLKNRGYAKELAERGYIVIAPDYPSFGGLTDFDFEQAPYQSGTMAGIFYHMRCIDLLLSLLEVDPNRIGVIGHSLGGHNAMFVAAFDQRIKVVVASCGWTQFEYYDIGPSAKKTYGGRLGPWAQDRYMPRIKNIYQLEGEKIPFNFHEIISLIAPRAFFTNSPVNDANFNLNGVKNGISKASKIYKFYNAGENIQCHYPMAEHDFPTEVRTKAYQFIDQKLSHIPSEHIIE